MCVQLMRAVAVVYVACCDVRVLELIHEAKWLNRLGITIPDAAQQIMRQEARFKSYNDHLQLCINEFKQVSRFSHCIGRLACRSNLA